MKKIIAMVLALGMMCGSAAMATEIKQDSTDKTAKTTVSYTIAANETYTVTIPSSVTLENTKGELSGTVSVRLQTPNFNVSGKTVAVTLTSSENIFNLVNGANKIAYTLKAGDRTYEANDTLLSWTYGNNTDQTLALVVDAYVDANLPAGDYTDTLTFTVSVTGGSNAGGIAGDVENPEISDTSTEN